MANISCTPIVIILLIALHMVYSYEPKMPEACKGMSYCFEKGENYPEEKIEKLLENMDKLLVDTPEKRMGDRSGSDSETDCPSETIEQPIYYITDMDDKVRVVVQSKNKKSKYFEQIYTVTTCKKEGLIADETRHFSSRMLSTFKLECVTSTMDLDFYVLSDVVDSKTGKPKMTVARAKGGIPVCCKCRYNLD